MKPTLLVANRGEIACRIIRAARSLSLRTVAVYSEADSELPHVGMADAAVAIGPERPAESYLNIAAVLEAAKTQGATLIHPGYGFLSENAAFADACAVAGMQFVGPTPEVIRLMGDKDQARQAAARAGVPVLPGRASSIRRMKPSFLRQAIRLAIPCLSRPLPAGAASGCEQSRAPKIWSRPSQPLRAWRKSRSATVPFT